MGIISIAVSVFILEIILSALFSGYQKIFTQTALVLIFILTVISVLNSAYNRKIKEITLNYSDLPKDLENFSIVHLSDIHLGKLSTHKWFQKIVDEVNNLNPDLIVITGDLIDEDISDSEEYCSELKRLKSTFGIFAVPGNHEYYAGINKFRNLADEAGISVLINSNKKINASLSIIGLDESSSKRMEGIGPKIDNAFEGLDENTEFKILMNHQPTLFNEAVKNGVNLQLSGHTHSGQLIPIYFLVRLLYKYPYGLYSENNSYIYTTSGTGTWGPPMRLCSRSEIVKITLKRNSVPDTKNNSSR